MIVLGFSGIGKTALFYNNNLTVDNYIDLDFKDFKIDGNVNWVESYVKCANYLHNQGKIVLISTHEEVQKEVITTLNHNDYVIIAPNKELLYEMCSIRKNNNFNIIDRIAETHYWEIESVVKLYSMNCIELTSSKYDLKKLILMISNPVESSVGLGPMKYIVNRKVDLDSKTDYAHWL